jgi:23S rRNA (pseudouridine1915-N3)-methyltransferase
MKLRVLWPGKTRKGYYREAIADYTGRIKKMIPFEVIETREESRTDKLKSVRIRKESEALNLRKRDSLTVVLDSAGKQLNSEQFAAWLGSATADIDFVLGGPHGLEIPGAALKFSFGNLTLPHELARVVLLEQIYRALTILKRIPYHK